MKGKSVEHGREAERSALRYLKRKGFRILARNYRSPYGEIDLIAKDGSILVFVEVKARSTIEYGNPEEVVGRAKIRRIVKTARYYIARFGLEDRECRFDVLTFVGGKAVEHVEGAFESNQ